MATRRRPRIVDRDGVGGTIREFHVEDLRSPSVAVELDGGAFVSVPFELLQHHDDGGYRIPAPWNQFVTSTDDGLSIPTIQEHVTVEVREARRQNVRVRRRVVSEPRVVETPISRNRVEVEHVPIGAYVDQAPSPRQEGDTLIIPYIEEVVVVEKRLRVREELRIRIVREQVTDRQTVVLRRHEVEIEDDAAEAITNNPHEGEDL